MKYALQLYSVRDFANTDLYTTLKKIKDMGYDGVELAGLYAHSVNELKDFLFSINLKAISAHIDISTLEDNVIDDTINMYNQLGCKYIVVPYLSKDYCLGNNKYSYTVERLIKACDIAQKYNMIVMYHNHEFEFNYMNEKGNMLENLYININRDNFKLQPDLAWVKVANNDPIEFIKTNLNKIGTIHLHDYLKVEDKIEFRPTGYGCQDINKILDVCEELNTDWIIIEQDDPSMNKNSLECAKMSIDFIKGLNK